MYPFYWTSSERGFIMRYSYEFKLKCVEMYRKGRWPETPQGVTQERFRHSILDWKKMVDTCGPESLKHKKQNKKWSAEEKFELVAEILAGNSYGEVALSNGISTGQLYNWVRKYKTMGYNGLTLKQGRKSKESIMKKKDNTTPLTESEREELIRLRAENAYMKAETEAIKKRMALRHEKWAAQLKAKKQQSSKNSENKDTN